MNSCCCKEIAPIRFLAALFRRSAWLTHSLPTGYTLRTAFLLKLIVACFWLCLDLYHLLSQNASCADSWTDRHQNLDFSCLLLSFSGFCYVSWPLFFSFICELPIQVLCLFGFFSSRNQPLISEPITVQKFSLVHLGHFISNEGLCLNFSFYSLQYLMSSCMVSCFDCAREDSPPPRPMLKIFSYILF